MSWMVVVTFLFLVKEFHFLWFIRNNYVYMKARIGNFNPGIAYNVLLTIPCKGIDRAFEQNITSFLTQKYSSYVVHFVLESESDVAYSELNRIVEKLGSRITAKEVKILIAGIAESSGQKVHNLLYSIENADDGVDVFAFADSDACSRYLWLSNLVHSLMRTKVGASTGYRWFVPEKNNFATIALSCLNAKIAQMVGKSRWNQAWGGSMAIRRETFFELELDRIWKTAISDDLTLSYAVKKAGYRIKFHPACLVASYEKTTLSKLFEFGRRQFMITRIMTPWVWLFALLSIVFANIGLWGGLVMSIVAFKNDFTWRYFILSLPIVMAIGQLLRAVLRQRLAWKLFETERESLKATIVCDILFAWFYSILMLVILVTSIFGRTITWRGIKYRMHGPLHTEKV